MTTAAPTSSPLDGLPDVSLWAAGIPDADTWAATLTQPYDDVPEFGAEDTEVDTTRRLNGDRRFVRTPTRRLFVDYRPQMDAYRHLNPLPAAGESLHAIISGKYALWDLVPAVVESDGTIDDLTIATLSYNKANASELLGMLDDGHVKHVSLLISYYFKSTSRPLYDALVPELRTRGFPVLAMRTHCKILLFKMANGARYVVESSANLRSSVNVEQMVMSNDPALYDFHAGWIAEMHRDGVELGGNDAR